MRYGDVYTENAFLLEISLQSVRIILLSVLAVAMIGIMVPSVFAQSSHPNLIVSAENTYWENTFSGFQVIEVIIDDPDISDITSMQTEPNVTVNGNTIRMAQATDGKWYGYVASKEFVQYADSTVINAGNGFDFGEFCASTTDSSELGVDFGDTQGVAIARPYQGTSSSTNGQTNFNSCSGGSIVSGNQINNVVRNPPTLVQSESIPTGQIGLNPDAFPIIQLYDFCGGCELFEYHKNGDVQEVDTMWDSVEPSMLEPQRNTQPDNFFYVELLFEGPFFNIDPTTRDSWTYTTNRNDLGLYYNIFDENGVDKGIQTVNVLSLDEDYLGADGTPSLIVENYYLTQGNNTPLDVQIHSNGLQTLDNSGGTMFLTSSSNVLTIKETENNEGIFTNLDDDGISNFRSDSFNPWKQHNVNYNVEEECSSGDTIRFEFYESELYTIVPFQSSEGFDQCATFFPSGINTTEDTPVSFTLSSNYDPHVAYSIESIPAHGIIQGTIPNLQYIPDENFFTSQGSPTLVITIKGLQLIHTVNCLK